MGEHGESLQRARTEGVDSTTTGQLSSSRFDYCYPWAAIVVTYRLLLPVGIEKHPAALQWHRASGIGHRLVQSASASGIEHHAKARAVIDWRSSWVALEAEQEVVLLATGLIKSAACQDSLLGDEFSRARWCKRSVYGASRSKPSELSERWRIQWHCSRIVRIGITHHPVALGTCA